MTTIDRRHRGRIIRKARRYGLPTGAILILLRWHDEGILARMNRQEQS